MENDLLNRLRNMQTKMLNAWPDYAADVVSLPYASDLTLRDFAAVMLLAPGEHVGRPAVEAALGGPDNADVAISSLAGHGLIVEEPGGLRLTDRGRELLSRVVEVRAGAIQRLLQVLPKPEQDQLLRVFEDLANAVDRAEALEKV